MTVSVTEPGGPEVTAVGRQWFRPMVYLPAAWLVLAIAAAVFAAFLPLPDPFKQALLRILQPPSAAHWLGTDALGRDVLSRSITGLRVSLVVGIGSVALGLVLGGALGLVSGYFRGVIDLWISAVMTVVLSFPPLVLAIAIMSFAQPSLVLVIVVLGILFVPAFARIARANTLSLVDREFVLAARAIGMRDSIILMKEVLPNLVAPMAAYSMLMVAVAIIGEAALSFLGLSVPPPQPTLGGMIAAERANLLHAPWSVFGPAGFLFLTILSLNIVGDQVQRRLDGREAAI